jgi:DMSO/TMAO reductase YedYZ heme-binding membrane subunit
MTGAGHVSAIVVTSSTPLWYATRATGLVALVLLTASMVLGLLSSMRFQRPGWPRFVTLGLHRNLSLLALAFTVAHVLTTVLDSFVSIPLPDAFIPFISSYRPIWVGLGAIAFDLMLALIITSLVRTRMGLRGWRLVHWGAYLCWPVAVVHGLGTGTDTPVHWVLVLTACCVLAVAAATLWRLGRGWSGRPVASAAGTAVVVAVLVAGVAWLRAGPLGPDWNVRSGTHSAQSHKTAAGQGDRTGAAR